MKTFTVRNFTFTYPSSPGPALKSINLAVSPGEFITLCGKTGSGKSTLLNNLKPPLAPDGQTEGDIFFNGRPLGAVPFSEQAARIGYVLQDPERQLRTGAVSRELTHGLESLGFDSGATRLRVAEMASFFGIQTWFDKDVGTLSGGQKQMLNLAAVMTLQPDVLILDEPTAQLDPIAAADFLEMVRKINREIGTTVIISEHRLEDVFPMCDRAIALDKGQVIADAHPKRVGVTLAQCGHDMFLSMPTSMQVFMQVETDRALRGDPGGAAGPAGVPSPVFPITIRDGREWLSGKFQNRSPLMTAIRQPGEDGRPAAPAARKPPALPGARRLLGAFMAGQGAAETPAIAMKDIWFRYGRLEKDIVKDLSLEVQKHKLTCIVGGNGTGKSTSLKLISGALKPYRGRIMINGASRDKLPPGAEGPVGMLPQDPRALLTEKTVELNLLEALGGIRKPGGEGLTADEKMGRLARIASLMELDSLLGRRPDDLSGGEQQRAAIGKALIADSEILLLDEPTKGMDSHFKEKLFITLKALLDQGKTVLMVSHDIEFCARHADVCALFFDGGIVTKNDPRSFFSGNSYYTTAANRMSRHVFENAVTPKDVVALCKANLTALAP
jgi:energy-coupling factor transport system ATP-binding protein